MDCYFIYSNSKVNTFILQDQPYPGLSVLEWENNCYTYGTLWDLGVDAGFTRLGKGKVYGQVWIVQDYAKIREFEELLGVFSGRTELVEIPVTIQYDSLLKEEIKALTNPLKQIRPEYQIVTEGRWPIRRS
jgi:hypothetical protein